MNDPYRCKECGTGYVVPSLARDCEQRHADTGATSGRQ